MWEFPLSHSLSVPVVNFATMKCQSFMKVCLHFKFRTFLGGNFLLILSDSSVVVKLPDIKKETEQDEQELEQNDKSGDVEELIEEEEEDEDNEEEEEEDMEIDEDEKNDEEDSTDTEIKKNIAGEPRFII